MAPAAARCRSSACILLVSLLPSYLALASWHHGAGDEDIFVPADLKNDVRWQTNIPFDPSWLKEPVLGRRRRRREKDATNRNVEEVELPTTHLSPPDFIDVFDFVAPVRQYDNGEGKDSEEEKACSDVTNKEEECASPSLSLSSSLEATAATASEEVLSLSDIGAAARRIVDSTAASSSPSNSTSLSLGVLFRNINWIKTADDFAEFWHAVCSTSSSPSSANDDSPSTMAEGGDGWTTSQYENPLEGPREKRGEIDVVPYFTNNGDTDRVLVIHNEQMYNPTPLAKIGFFCLQDAAWGGESLLARNVDATKHVSQDILDYVKEHGGVRYRFTFPHKDNHRNHHRRRTNQNDANFTDTSWQAICGVETMTDAIQCFKERGFHDISFDHQENAVIYHTLSGFLRDARTNTDVWFNHLHQMSHPEEGWVTLGDGSVLPDDMLKRLKADLNWKATMVLKLNPGDFLLLNNKEVMHGRLPFGDPKDKRRKLLSVYTV